MDSSYIEDEDKEALAGLNSIPAARKIHSHSQQLRANSGQKRLHQVRKHSLDDISVPLDSVYDDTNDSTDDDEFFPRIRVSDRLSGGDDYVELQPQFNAADDFNPLPEFIAAGAAGLFKVPTRAAVHPARPPCLELRPHPLRETQGGRFLRNIACTETQLWAGQECGVRFWNFDDVYELGRGIGGRVRRGDEDAAPFHESVNASPTTCLVVDQGNKLVYSGHKDGKIRAWSTEHNADDTNPFKESLSWQAHRGTVNSIIISAYGDMWSCSEGGIIRIWPWETVEKSLSLKSGEKHMAALLVERSVIDLRSQVTVNGSCSISSSVVKCLLADHVRAKVWAAQVQTFSLWDARTKELLKVFNVEGQVENRVENRIESRADMQSSPEQPPEDETKVKLVSSSKKEKPHGFLQRSRHAIMGAAGAVRRVATRGAGYAEDAKRTEAIVLAGDGTIWTGCTNGLLVQWDGNGNRLQDVNHHQCAVLCFCTYGVRIYIGYLSGYIQVMDLEGNLIAGWVGHTNPVIKLAAGGGFIFSMATHGGIRGWNITSPGPLDAIMRSALAENETNYAKRANIRILTGTWNVGQGRASQEALFSWLGSVASDVGIVVVGLQEVDMGAGFLAMSAAKETVGLEGSSVGQWWLDNIGKALEDKTTFEHMGSRQLAGLLISLWVRKNLRNHVGDTDVAAVPCGFGRAIGNKGGVGIRIRVFDRIMCFVNCHLAAHLEAVNRRNADFDHIYRTMGFSRSSQLINAAAAAVTTAPALKNSNNTNISTEESKTDLAEADMVVFIGDFNYRLFGISYDEARDFVSQRCFDWLRERDQLRAEMKAGKVFQGMREAIITFPPTYKFERHRPGLAGYDSGEKKRIPAWCDRVIFRDSRSNQVTECSLECPVVSSVLLYEACMDVTESDHKPVRCKFHVKIGHVDRSERRQRFGEIIRSNEKVRSMLSELSYVPETIVNTNNITLETQDTAILRITNTCLKDKALFKIVCEGQAIVREDGEEAEFLSRGSSGFPRWLEVTPAAGIIKPDQSVEVSVHHEEFHTLEEFVDGIPQNWWCEDTRDKEVILVVTVQGSCSTETKTHRVHVRHCFSVKPFRIDSKDRSLKKQQGSSHNNRSEVCQRSNSSDKSNDRKKTADTKSNDRRKSADNKPDDRKKSADNKSDDRKKSADNKSDDRKKSADNKSDDRKKSGDNKSDDRKKSADSKSDDRKKSADSKSEDRRKSTDNKPDDRRKSTDNKPEDRRKSTDNKPEDRRKSTDNKPDDRRKSTDNKSDDRRKTADKKSDDRNKIADDKSDDCGKIADNLKS